jgi:hypothetical protein
MPIGTYAGRHATRDHKVSEAKQMGDLDRVHSWATLSEGGG